MFIIYSKNLWTSWEKQRHVVVQLVEALRYKPEGHGFNS
jgi:hypothetical protein